MLALCLMLLDTYCAKNYAGIIDSEVPLGNDHKAIKALEDSIIRGGRTSEEWEGSKLFVSIDHLLFTVPPDSVLPQLHAVDI